MININEIVTNFYLIGCAIRQIEIKNDILLLSGKEKMELGIGVEPEYQGIIDKHHSGNVKLTIEISAKREEDLTKSTTISATIEGVFSAHSEMSEEQFKQMLSINGAAALYSIMRGKIEAITSNVFANGKIEIPFVNFMNYYDNSN